MAPKKKKKRNPKAWGAISTTARFAGFHLSYVFFKDLGQRKRKNGTLMIVRLEDIDMSE